MLKLSAKFSDQLKAQPETGLGYCTADVILKDGSVARNATIVNAEFVASVQGKPYIPFTEDAIAAILVTSRKPDLA